MLPGDDLVPVPATVTLSAQFGVYAYFAAAFVPVLFGTVLDDTPLAVAATATGAEGTGLLSCGTAFMKPTLVASLRCPACQTDGLDLTIHEANDTEVRSGDIVCPGCGRSYPIVEGIADFVDPEDEQLASEIAGWKKLAGPLDENLVPVMSSLPHFPHEPWFHVAADFFQVFEEVDFAGKRVVDLGAGRTWSTRFLATLGRAGEVIAIDVLTDRFLGLGTADVFFGLDHIYFDRLRVDMHTVPLRDGWADIVFSCASIHHSSDLDRLFREVRRLLRPGGLFIFVSEPAKDASIKVKRPNNAETEAGINENFYSLDEYFGALRRSELRPRRIVPRTIRYRLRYPDDSLRPQMPPLLSRLGTRWGPEIVMRLLASRWVGPHIYRRWSLPLSVIARAR